MPAEVVNLRRFRKAKAREEKARQADENRARHGVSKAERRATDASSELEARRLEGHRVRPLGTRDDDPSEPSA